MLPVCSCLSLYCLEAAAQIRLLKRLVKLLIRKFPYNLESIPKYTSEPYVMINENVPFFTESDFTEEAFETYSDLDELGRCGAAFANVGKETMPTEERGQIGMIK